MLYPMFALVLVTYTVLLINFIWRVHAVRGRQVSLKYFRVFEGGDVPEHLKAGSRHFANLFELPVLFYVAGLAAMALQLESRVLINLAWAFVLFRLLHAMIHLSYNKVLHRMLSFMGGVVIVLSMWVVLIMEYAAKA